MATTAETRSEPDAARRDALVERLFAAILATMDLASVYLGDKLGFYRALAERPGATASELAAAAGTTERYTREWLEQQAVTGLLEVEDTAEPAEARRYSISREHAEVLLDRESLSYMTPLAPGFVACVQQLPAIQKAFRTGGGVPWEQYGADLREAQAAMNRPQFVNLLASEWLPAIPDAHSRLQADPPALVADIACGAGWSSIAIAKGYPNVQVNGFDLDAEAIELARANAAAAGVDERVSFFVRDAADSSLAGRYDLVTVFEAIHDMSRPVEALRTMRGLAAESGTVLVMDERVAETFTAPGDDIERLLYGFSILACLPTGMAEQPSAATGTVMRTETFRRYAAEAGFSNVEVLPIEHDMFRFYRLRSEER